MPTYPVVLTDIEDLALQAVTKSVRDFVNINTKQRANMVINDIVKIVVQNCAYENIPIPPTVDEIVTLGFEKGWIEKFKEPTPAQGSPPIAQTSPQL